MSGVGGPGAKALEIDPPPGMRQAGVVFHGILHRRVIVDRRAVNDVYAADLSFVCVANIRVVQEEGLVGSIISCLNERTELAVDLAPVKDAHVLHHEIVVGLQAIEIALPVSR